MERYFLLFDWGLKIEYESFEKARLWKYKFRDEGIYAEILIESEDRCIYIR